MTVRASLFSFFESRIVRVTNLEFSRNDRNSKILSRTILSAGGNGPRVPRKGKLGRGMRYAYSPHHSPTQLSLDSSDSWLSTIEAFVGGRAERESKGLESWIPPKLGRPRVSGRGGGGEEAAARSVEDLSSSNTGSSSSSPLTIPSRCLSSQENLHFSLIVLHQRACVIET